MTKQVLVYPNPTENFIHIKLSGLSGAQFTLVCIDGKELLNMQLTNDVDRIRLPDNPGIYFGIIRAENFQQTIKIYKST